MIGESYRLKQSAGRRQRAARVEGVDSTPFALALPRIWDPLPSSGSR
jgi:hypothetical protein